MSKAQASAPVAVLGGAAEMEADESRMEALGYKPELSRALGTFTNFGLSFSIISIITGIGTEYGYGLATGGPVVMVWTWPIVSLFSAFVAASMAEICSEYPLAGGVYFWAAHIIADEDEDEGKQGGEKEDKTQLSAFWAWETAWFNILGQIGLTAGVDYGAARVIASLANVATDGSFTATVDQLLWIYAILLASHAIVNSMPVHVMGKLVNVSVWWHIFGVLIIVITLFATAPKLQSSSFVFTHYHNETGIESVPWVVGIGLLVAQFTYTGYDTSAHISEETKGASKAAPLGIVSAVVMSFLPGWILILGLTYCIQDYENTILSATGFAITQIFLDCAGKNGACVLTTIVAGALWFCGLGSLTGCSRIIWALARDGGMPFSKQIAYVLPGSKIPVVAVWVGAALSFILATPSVKSTVAFGAITSIGTIGLYISYAIPIFLVLIKGKKIHGSFSLGGWSPIIRTLSVLWVMMITVLFCLPEVKPVTSQTFNYSCLAVGIVLCGSLSAWFLSAKNWFVGPMGRSKIVDTDKFVTSA